MFGSDQIQIQSGSANFGSSRNHRFWNQRDMDRIIQDPANLDTIWYMVPVHLYLLQFFHKVARNSLIIPRVDQVQRIFQVFDVSALCLLESFSQNKNKCGVFYSKDMLKATQINWTQLNLQLCSWVRLFRMVGFLSKPRPSKLAYYTNPNPNFIPVTNPESLIPTLSLTLSLILFPKPKPISLCPGFCQDTVLYRPRNVTEWTIRFSCFVNSTDQFISCY